VEGVNRVWKHVRPSQRNPQGGRIQKEAPIHVSNVMLVDPTTGKHTRTRMEVREDGAEYGAVYVFNHERLDVYQLAIRVQEKLASMQILDRLS
jgi:ribosomal protein L24